MSTATTTSAAHWTCKGDVRGDCGHKHRSYATAAACCIRDGRGVTRGHGSSAYSDRYVVFVDANGDSYIKDDE